MVHLPSICISEMLVSVEKHFPKETGGLILGELVSESEWIITNVTMPGVNATHRNHSYVPDDEHDTEEISRIYRKTNCQSVYLGDWHSHPNSSSYMSEKDKRTLRSIAEFKDARMQCPIMIVLGTSPFEVRCWTYRKSRLFKKVIFEVPIGLKLRPIVF